MNLSLTWKLTLSYLTVALVMAAALTFFIRRTNTAQFNQLIVEQERTLLHDMLIEYYLLNGSWAGLNTYIDQQAPPQDEAPRPPQPHNQPLRHNNNDNNNGVSNNRGNFGIVDADDIVLIPLPGSSQRVGQPIADTLLAQGEPVFIDDVLIATILTIPTQDPGLTPAEKAYLQRTDRALLAATAVAVVIAMLFGLYLARRLIRPIHALTQATKAMTQHTPLSPLPIYAHDEIGQLTAAFNTMSRNLNHANQRRRQMTADIAHDLRTPIQVIAGYIEAMRDNVLPPTSERYDAIYTEIEHLQHLVTDLSMLSQVDAGELILNQQALPPQELLQRTQNSYKQLAQQKGIALTIEAPSTLPHILVDEERMAQVLGNLLSNALRHTPKNGRIALKAKAENGHVHLTVQDNGSGIARQDLPHIFERFYRADKSRQENEGESGLGLAIAKALVEAHEGNIAVYSQPRQGTTFIITIPTPNS